MPEKPTPNRRSIRLPGYDYSLPGAYFVTLVAHRYKCIFGKIIEKEMHLSDLGMIAHETWMSIPEHFRHVEVDPIVVMPNHIHGIITINDHDHRRGTIFYDDDRRGTIFYNDDRRGTIYRAPKTTEKFGKPVKGSIPTIIRTFKASVTRRARRELELMDIWQRNYYEHIIRNEQELIRVWDYIDTNPIRWQDDRLYPDIPPTGKKP